MIRRGLLKKETVFLLFASIICGVAVSFLSFSPDLKELYNSEQIFISIREFGVEPGEFSVGAIYCALPIILMVLFIFNGVAEDYAIIKNYVFMQSESVKPWFISNAISVFILSLAASFFYNGAIVCSCISFGFKVENVVVLIKLFLYSFFVTALIVYVVSIVAVTCAFFTNTKNSIIISAVTLIVSFIVSTVLPKSFTKWFWSSSYYLSWHTSESDLLISLYGKQVVSNEITTTFSFSIIYLIVFSSVITWASYRLIAKSDYI